MRSSGLLQLQCLMFIGFAALVYFRVFKTATESTDAFVASKTAFLEVDFAKPTTVTLHAELPQQVASLIETIRAEAAQVANGGDDGRLDQIVPEEVATAIAANARSAAEAIRRRAEVAAGPEAQPAAAPVAVELLSLGTHVAPVGDPRYAEVRVGYARTQPSASLTQRRIFGDQVWRAWLVPGSKTGNCTHCGAPLPMKGAQTCEYCGAQAGDVMWRVLQADTSNNSDAFLAGYIPYMNGRSVDEVLTGVEKGSPEYYARSLVFSHSTSSAETKATANANAVAGSGGGGAEIEDFASKLDESLDRIIREG